MRRHYTAATLALRRHHRHADARRMLRIACIGGVSPAGWAEAERSQFIRTVRRGTRGRA